MVESRKKNCKLGGQTSTLLRAETVTGRLDHQVGERNTSHQENQETEAQEILSGELWSRHAQPLPSPATGKLPPSGWICKGLRTGQKKLSYLKKRMEMRDGVSYHPAQFPSQDEIKEGSWEFFQKSIGTMRIYTMTFLDPSGPPVKYWFWCISHFSIKRFLCYFINILSASFCKHVSQICFSCLSTGLLILLLCCISRGLEILCH